MIKSLYNIIKLKKSLHVYLKDIRRIKNNETVIRDSLIRLLKNKECEPYNSELKEVINISHQILERIRQQEDAYKNKEYIRLIVLDEPIQHLTKTFHEKWNALEPKLQELS